MIRAQAISLKKRQCAQICCKIHLLEEMVAVEAK
jgi:hypothetical protein